MQTSKEELKKKYWEGTGNKAIRYWYYLQRGLDIFNNFKYVFMAIAALYFAMKLNNLWWLVGIFSLTVPALMWAGYFQTHHISKVTDWLSTEFSTYWSKYGYTLQEDQNQILRDIREYLKEKKDASNT